MGDFKRRAHICVVLNSMAAIGQSDDACRSNEAWYFRCSHLAESPLLAPMSGSWVQRLAALTFQLAAYSWVPDTGAEASSAPQIEGAPACQPRGVLVF